MQYDAARSLQLVENLTPVSSGIADLVKSCDDPYLKANFYPANDSTPPVDATTAHNNAVAELSYLTRSLSARLDYLKRLVPEKTRNKLKKTEPIYCKCRREAFGDMVGCDDPECPYEWYHIECVGITVAPKGKWLCPLCRERIGLTTQGRPKKNRKVAK